VIRDLLYVAAVIAPGALLLAVACAAGPLADWRTDRRRARQHRAAHTFEGQVLTRLAALRRKRKALELAAAATVTFPAVGTRRPDEAVQAWMRGQAIRRGVRLVTA
jgi:Ni/Co efflux regulator RcnB